MSQVAFGFDEHALRRAAVFSIDERYRTILWIPLVAQATKTLRVVTFLMLNPSTADDKVNDPTVKRCIEFAKSWGYDGVFIANLFAFRGTDPRSLLTVEDPTGGPANDRAIGWMASQSEEVVCAWGDGPNGFESRITERSRHVLNMLLWGMEPRIKVSCLNPLIKHPTTKAGNPRHPLYLSSRSERTSLIGALTHPTFDEVVRSMASDEIVEFVPL